MLRRALAAILFAAPLGLFSCGEGHSNAASNAADRNDSLLAATSIISTDSGAAGKPFLAARLRQIDSALRLPMPVLRFPTTDPMLLSAQDAALADARFTARIRNERGEPLRTEIFGVYPARPGDVPGGQAAGYYRVELYNYALNLTTVAIVAPSNRSVSSVAEYAGTQPDIPPALTDLALKIAVNAPEVITALGAKPGEGNALMASTKTALNRSRCERSGHLCVAPTFIKGDRALWAIVDLTDYRLVGIRWTQVGETGTPDRALSERRLTYDKVMSCHCDVLTPLARDGWKMDYVITSSDGLRISDVSFRGKPVLVDAKLVDWHVSYSGTDGFGYSDAVGCPEYSQAAVVAVRPPAVKALVEDARTVGFVLEQEFSSEQWPQPCNYNYVQRYEFYTDGRFRAVCGSLGRGCGNDGTYRPVMRLHFAGDGQRFAEWTSGGWKPWTQEGWRLQDAATAYSPQGYQYSIADAGGRGFYLAPGRAGSRGSRGDNAWVFVTRHHPDRDEGARDLVTIGPCCNTDYRQGPEKFIEPSPENLSGGGLVVWYVAQLKNDDRPGQQYCWAESKLESGVPKTVSYPCLSGPLFVPMASPQPTAAR